jgi:hypothetical protein
VRTVAGFAVLTLAGMALTRAWVPLSVFFAVACLTPEVCARLRHRHFYGRRRTP